MRKPLKKLLAKHLQAIQLRLENIKNSEIAKQLNIAEITLNCWVCDPLFKAEEERQRNLIVAQAKQTLANGINKAAITLVNACDKKSYNLVNIKAAELVLNYNGMEPAKKVDINSKVKIIDDITEEVYEDES